MRGASFNVPAKAHGDGAGGDFGDAGGEDDGGGGIGAGEAGGEGEGDSEAIGDADDDVPDYLAGGEVLLLVLIQKLLLLRFQPYPVFVATHLCSTPSVSMCAFDPNKALL